jgi:hypothetical protein
MKKHTTLYVLGGALLLVGAYMYMKKPKATPVNLAPPMEEGSTTTTPAPAPAPASTGSTLSGASQVIDSLKGLLAEIKNKSQNAVKTMTPTVL